MYIGKSAISSGFGAAGSLVVVLVWVYYSAQIFLLGAEFTKVFSHVHGSRKRMATPRADGWCARGTDRCIHGSHGSLKNINSQH